MGMEGELGEEWKAIEKVEQKVEVTIGKVIEEKCEFCVGEEGGAKSDQSAPNLNCASPAGEDSPCHT